ncbi:MAG: peptide ABC transporter substrate-binding protein [Roseiflexus sp.]|nr:peptide ABC transporter substrate-binding protein [Roseiflexus sp.]MCS7289873.1 peptide ABC transporter substrate-binding protein [Roseiflexus sp.]MDW8145151.1 peptide ABC transporter substrate-binding protein [Roseiflexaceae bacterium]MDW8231807.1 peptide ABC transporter substrate-binding protein [Roseiflexaceae bacterium]
MQLVLIRMMVCIVLVGCTIEGGVATPTPIPATSSTGPIPTSAIIGERIAERSDTWIIGTLDLPSDLYPYPQSAATRRATASITEVLFPSPILTYDYAYTVTGVLERIPTLENGDVELRKVDAYLDATGALTTTVTDVVTQVDQLVITFRWNPRLRWSDGTPVTADDSVFAYELAKAAPPGDAAAELLAKTAAYEKVSDHTTRAVLRPDYVGAAYFMSYWTPLPRHLLQGVDPARVRESAFARQPVGYGPYMIVERTATELRFERNPYYFGPAPAASRLVFREFADLELLRANLLNGNLDLGIADRISPTVLERFDADAAEGTLQVITIPSPVWEHILFNLDVPVLQDIRVRRALAYGTNRQAIADALFGGRTPVLDSWVLPGHKLAAPPDQLTRYPYDPDRARQLLEEAGYTDSDGDGVRVSSDGITLTLQLLTTQGSEVRREIARRFQDDMRAIGVQIDINEAPPDEMFASDGPLYLRQFDLALFGWIAGPEPGGLQLWSCAAVPGESNNYRGENFAGWCFRDADRAVRTADTTLDPVERAAAYLRQQQLWTQELPAIPLFQRLSIVVAAPSVRGLAPDALAPVTWNVAAWKREGR